MRLVILISLKKESIYCLLVCPACVVPRRIFVSPNFTRLELNVENLRHKEKVTIAYQLHQDGFTPLMAACCGKAPVGVVRTLIDAGSSLTAQDEVVFF